MSLHSIVYIFVAQMCLLQCWKALNVFVSRRVLLPRLGRTNKQPMGKDLKKARIVCSFGLGRTCKQAPHILSTHKIT